MEYTFPHYYKEFKCIADKCPATCCAGWQIVIDKKSLQKYKKRKDSFGNRLKNSIDWKEEVFLQREKRCAFLDDDNLCDIYKEAGPDFLCKTCRTYPRHIEEFEGIREISLSMSCPEAAKMIVSCKDPVRFVTKERSGEESYEDFDYFLYTKLVQARKTLFEILCNRNLSIEKRMAFMLAFSHDLQIRIDKNTLFEVDGLIERYTKEGANERFEKRMERFFALEGNNSSKQKVTLLRHFMTMETLQKQWHEKLGKTLDFLWKMKEEQYQENKKAFLEQMEKQHAFSIIKEQWLIYFLYTYFCGAVYGADAFSKVKLAFCSVILMEELLFYDWIFCGREVSFDEIIKVSYEYSRELEHSDLNLNHMEEVFYEEEAFSLYNLLKL